MSDDSLNRPLSSLGDYFGQYRNSMKNSRNSSTRNIARIAALRFAYECGCRGAIVSPPLVGDARYDYVVDSATTHAALFRVKIVTSKRMPNSESFSINTQRKVAGKQISYKRHEVDCIVTRVEEDWYFFSQPHSLTSNQVISSTKPNPNAKKNDWALLGLPPKRIH
jgi:hypothetical protein